MPSKAAPEGSLPETKVTPLEKDVKQAASSSKAETKVAEAKEPNVEESDLIALQEEGKIPYSRFKEKNDESKRYKTELEETNKRYQEDMRRLMVEKETLLAVSRQAAPQSGVIDIVDPLERETKSLKNEVDELKRAIHSMKDQSNEDRLKSLVSKLENKYPDADTLAVLGWKKQQPGTDLEELMELSHTRNVERAEKKLKAIIEQKKQRAKSGPQLSDSGYKINENEKPKSVKEANAIIKRLFS